MSTPTNQNVLTIPNHHSDACGVPPAITPEKQQYTGYFENEHGEQWVFTYDRQTRKGVLRGGDVEWQKIYEVTDGTVQLVMAENERIWLALCWVTAKTWEK